MRLSLLALVTALAPTAARAGGAFVDDPSTRSVGRAGATLVSDDGEGALELSPAALARRVETRVRVGVEIRNRDLDFDPTGAALSVQNQANPTTSPSVSAAMGVGPIVFGLAYVEPRAFHARLPAPSFGQPTTDIDTLFAHRYAGLELSLHVRELRVGVAARVTDWLAIGAAAGVRHVSMDETRTLWAGFSGRDGLANPTRDLVLHLSASDDATPAGNVGVLIAPLEIPIEATVAVGAYKGATLSGRARPEATQPTSPTTSGDASAHIELPDQLIATAGARATIGRVTAELGFIERLLSDSGTPPAWTTGGLQVTDESGVTRAVPAIPSAWVPRRHLSVQAAVDVDVLPGSLLATAGYRFHSAATPNAYASPTAVDLGGHTVAIGAEVYLRGITATLGYAHTFVAAARRDQVVTELINPFDGGTETVGAGRYDRADDVVGLSIECAWEGDTFL